MKYRINIALFFRPKYAWSGIIRTVRDVNNKLSCLYGPSFEEVETSDFFKQKRLTEQLYYIDGENIEKNIWECYIKRI